MSSLYIVVAVPGSVVELNKTDTLFDHFARKQALAAKGIRGVVPETIQFLGLRVLMGEVQHFRHFHLHPERELVAVHARAELIMPWMALQMLAIQRSD